MKHKRALGHLNDPDADAFFREGDDGTYSGGPGDSIPAGVVDVFDDLDEDTLPRLTSEQLERRARNKRWVTGLVAALGAGSILAMVMHGANGHGDELAKTETIAARPATVAPAVTAAAVAPIPEAPAAEAAAAAAPPLPRTASDSASEPSAEATEGTAEPERGGHARRDASHATTKPLQASTSVALPPSEPRAGKHAATGKADIRSEAVSGSGESHAAGSLPKLVVVSAPHSAATSPSLGAAHSAPPTAYFPN